MMNRPRSRRHYRAFTLTELIVVVAILVLLMSLVVIATRKAVLMARVANCLSNQRQIAFAQSSYTTDHNGAYASNQTKVWPGMDLDFTISDAACGNYDILINNGVTTDTKYHGWVASYGANMQSAADGEREKPGALKNGRIWNYLGDLDAYKSPLEPKSDRIRSYSLNGFVGSTVPEDSSWRAQDWHAWFCAKGVSMPQLKTTHASGVPAPARTICSIVEDDRRLGNLMYNAGGWLFDPRTPAGTPDMNPQPAIGWQGWIDWPAFWYPEAITYSYVDGSTESYALQRPALVGEIEGPSGWGHGYLEPAYDGFRRDWYHFRERLLPGVIPALPLKHTPGG